MATVIRTTARTRAYTGVCLGMNVACPLVVWLFVVGGGVVFWSLVVWLFVVGDGVGVCGVGVCGVGACGVVVCGVVFCGFLDWLSEFSASFFTCSSSRPFMSWMI